MEHEHKWTSILCVRCQIGVWERSHSQPIAYQQTCVHAAFLEKLAQVNFFPLKFSHEKKKFF